MFILFFVSLFSIFKSNFAISGQWFIQLSRVSHFLNRWQYHCGPMLGPHHGHFIESNIFCCTRIGLQDQFAETNQSKQAGKVVCKCIKIHLLLFWCRYLASIRCTVTIISVRLDVICSLYVHVGKIYPGNKKTVKYINLFLHQNINENKTH